MGDPNCANMIVTADESWCNQATKPWAFTGFRSGLLHPLWAASVSALPHGQLASWLLMPCPDGVWAWSCGIQFRLLIAHPMPGLTNRVPLLPRVACPHQAWACPRKTRLPSPALPCRRH